MFTGIVQGRGTVLSIEKGEAVWTFSINLPNTTGLERGASVAVNGVCLTATDMDGDKVQFDVIQETLERTNLGRLLAGDEVNIERSLKMGDELGGHLLSGHIMGTGQITARTEVGEGVDLTVSTPSSMMKFIHEKGYIGLNGASLTIGEVVEHQFNIHLIPETLRLTTFASIQKGDLINIEIDAMTQTIVATVERIMKQEK
ncbi:MAG: riboflavin synthase subunit alpha [Candidatus Poseidoniales archaeon]